MTTTAAFGAALNTAWGLNRHSVVEVMTERGTNVELHRRVQKQVALAVQAAYRLLVPPPCVLQRRDPPSSTSRGPLGPAAVLSPLQGGPAAVLSPPLQVEGLTWRRFSLPLAKALTTAPKGGSRGLGTREGVLVTIRLKVSSSSSGDGPQQPGGFFSGAGEVSPLPGLHRESLAEAEQQLALVAALLRGARVPRTAALLGGRLGDWFRSALGFHPEQLHPSVRFGIESAVLGALAAEQGVPLAQLLQSNSNLGVDAASSSAATALPEGGQRVLVNGLVAGVSGAGGVEGAVAEAVRLVREEGCSCLKIKVARRWVGGWGPPHAEVDLSILLPSFCTDSCHQL